MTTTRQKSRYGVLRFPEDFPQEWRLGADGEWFECSALSPLGRLYWVSQREEGAPEYIFSGTGQFESRDDGELAEVFMPAWPEVKRWDNIRLLSVPQLQAADHAPARLWDEFQRLYKDLLGQVGERTITPMDPTLRLMIELEAEEPRNLPKEASGRTEPNQG